MLEGINQCMRALADKVWIQLLAVKIRLARTSRRFWCFCVIQVLTLDANAPVREPKMAASAEIVAGLQDPPINLIFRPYRDARYLE